MPDIECGQCVAPHYTETYPRTTHFNRFERSGKRSKNVERDIAFSREVDLFFYVDPKNPFYSQLRTGIYNKGTLRFGYSIHYTKSPEQS